jgi:hypothetical protein
MRPRTDKPPMPFAPGTSRGSRPSSTPHVVWHVPGNHPRAGDIRGRDALLAWLAGLTEVGFWLTEHDVFANDEHVCALSYMGVVDLESTSRPGS